MGPSPARRTLCTFFEQFHDKVSYQQMLCLRHELSISAAGGVPQTIFTRFPDRESHRHVSTVLHEETTGLKSRFPCQIRQHIGRIYQRKLAHLILTDRFADYHSCAHAPYFLVGCFATSRSFTLSYCSLVISCFETRSALLRKGRACTIFFAVALSIPTSAKSSSGAVLISIGFSFICFGA